MRFVASCVFALSVGLASAAEAKEAAPPEAPPSTNAPDAVTSVAPTPFTPSQPAVLETYEEPEMHSVGMFAAGIALLIGGAVNSAIGIGIIVATSDNGGFGGILAAVVGLPILFDGTVQISVGIPLIVVGGADAEMEPDPNERAVLGELPARSGLTLTAPF